jgi:hypothetical protein
MPVHNIIDNCREKLVDHINRIRCNSMTGDHLLKALSDLYHQYGMQDWWRRQAIQRDNHEILTIICSQALVYPQDYSGGSG